MSAWSSYVCSSDLTPDAVVVSAGDARVSPECEQLSAGADVLVHEGCRTSAMAPMIAGTVFETIFSYHADTVQLGAMAARADVSHLVLTHLIPPPESHAAADAYTHDLREGGSRGRVTVGRPLTTITL